MIVLVIVVGLLTVPLKARAQTRVVETPVPTAILTTQPDNSLTETPKPEIPYTEVPPTTMLTSTSSSTASSLSSSFLLTATPTNVQWILSENVTLQCAYNASAPENVSSVQKISSIRMLKVDSSNNWNVIAEINAKQQSVLSYTDVYTTGYIGASEKDTYLQIVWPTVSAETFGEYRCEVSALNGNKVMNETTDIVNILEHSINTDEILQLLHKQRHRIREELKDEIVEQKELIDALNQTIKYQTNTLDELKNNISACLQTCPSNTEHLKEIYMEINSLKQKFVQNSFSWPEGSYGLLSPETGCPSGKNWKPGFVTVHSDTVTHNKDETSMNSHFKTPVQIKIDHNSYMMLSFCTVDEGNGTLPWPAGSYCIHRRNGTCPNGFNSGYLRLDEDDDSPSGPSGGYIVDHTRHSSTLYLYFCCRRDASPHTAAVLPTGAPFYLYRFNGMCQEVAGMTVTSEYMLIDTESGSNADGYENVYHPDGHIQDVQLELCYYEAL